MRGDEVHFLIGMDEHRRKVGQAAADEGIAPQTLVDRVAERFRRRGNGWGSRTTSSSAHLPGTHRRRPRAHRADLRPQPGRFLREIVRGALLRRMRSVRADGEIVDDRCVLHPTRILQWVEERNWFFRLSRSRISWSRTSRNTRSSSVPRAAATRSWRCWARASRICQQPRALHLGHSLSPPDERRRDANDVRLVRCAAELPHRHRVPGPVIHARWPAHLHVVGKDITRFH